MKQSRGTPSRGMQLMSRLVLEALDLGLGLAAEVGVRWETGHKRWK